MVDNSQSLPVILDHLVESRGDDVIWRRIPILTGLHFDEGPMLLADMQSDLGCLMAHEKRIACFTRWCTYPRPIKGIAVAITVMNCTFA